MHWYKTLAWWVIFRCQYTLTSNNQLLGCLNPPRLVLFSAVDVVAKHSSVNKTTMNAGSRFPKAFLSSAGIFNLPITSTPVDNFNDRALWCKPTGINYNMHGWILCRYCATGWFWWIRGLRAVKKEVWMCVCVCVGGGGGGGGGVMHHHTLLEVANFTAISGFSGQPSATNPRKNWRSMNHLLHM